MKSWWDMTKEEQDARMAIEPLSLGGVQETFRHPASYAELRLVQTVWKYVEEARAFKKALGEIAECADYCEECEPTDRKLATHLTHHARTGAIVWLCSSCAEKPRDAEVEEHEQDVETTIALKALGMLPLASDGRQGGE